MKVSIITTCLNRESMIGDTIESVIMQDYPEIEYIVIDGASKDRSMSVIMHYENRIAALVSEPDGGMYEAINKGLCLATGDIIGLLHSDDILFARDTISQIVRTFRETKADLVYGNGLFVDSADPSRVIRNWISGDYDKAKVKGGWLPLHPTVYMTRESVNKLGAYDESFRIASDSDYLIRCLYETSLKVTYLNEYIVRMRMGGLSTRVGNYFQKWSEDIRLYRNHGFNPYTTLGAKVLSKIPQFISAKRMKYRFEHKPFVMQHRMENRERRRQ